MSLMKISSTRVNPQFEASKNIKKFENANIKYVPIYSV